MFGRRILVLVAVLMGLTALAASLSPPPESVRRGEPTPSPTAAPPVAEAPAQAPRTIQARLHAAGPPRQFTASVGDTIALRVSGDVLDTVVIDDLAVSEPIDPESPAQVEIYADIPGRYPIELLDSGRRIGALHITRAS